MTDEEKIETLHQTLEATAEFLNADELEIVIEVAQGLVRGQQVHGFADIDNDERDFLAEGDEEMRDWMAYMAMALIQMRRRRTRGAQ